MNGKFSVLISVYGMDHPGYFDTALHSIYDDQTLKPSQIVLVIDGVIGIELERCVSMWEHKLESLLSVVRLGKNKGLGCALNEGLKACKYEIIARMDSDDISLPKRFEEQVVFLERNPEIDVLGAYIEEFDSSSNAVVGCRHVPTDDEHIKIMAKRRNPISHPVVMFKKSVVLNVGGYPEFRKSQDYALWSKLIVKGARFANMPKVLLRMRAGTGLMHRRGWRYLMHERAILKFQRDIGMISTKCFYENILIRSVFRLAPTFIKKQLYMYGRG